MSQIYKIKKNYQVLLLLLFLSSIFFNVSHLMVDGNPIKFVVLIFMAGFIGWMLLGAWAKRVEISEDAVIVKGLLGTKSVQLSDLKDASVINMKGRSLCILSDSERYVFISSLFDGFVDIIQHVVQVAPDDIMDNLKKIDTDNIEKKSKLMNSFLIFAILFLIGISVYNMM